MDKNKSLFFKTYIGSLLKTADKFTNLTFAELKRIDNNKLKSILKELNVPYYETNIRNLNKIEIDENGESFNPIIKFIENTPDQKVLIITIDDTLKKKDLENLANMKFYSEINKYNIKPNTLIIINNNKNKKDIIKSTINRIKEDKEKEKYILIFHDILYI